MTKGIKEQAAKAAQYIRDHGWFQGNYYGPDGCVCVLGAIRAATGQDDSCALVKLAAIRAGVSRYDLDTWNDEKGRTKEEVLNLLDGIANEK